MKEKKESFIYMKWFMELANQEFDGLPHVLDKTLKRWESWKA